MKAGTGGVFVADHERIAVAVCAPYFHLLCGTVEVQGHCQWPADGRQPLDGLRTRGAGGNSSLPISPPGVLWINASVVAQPYLLRDPMYGPASGLSLLLRVRQSA